MDLPIAQDPTTFRRIVELRRSFHEHPELAFEEVRTAEVITEELDRLGIDYEYVGKGGAVIGRLEEARAVDQDYPSMGAEDFGFYLQQMPGCYVRFGARMQEDMYIPLHSPRFDIDENVLAIGTAFLERVARVAVDRYGASR